MAAQTPAAARGAEALVEVIHDVLEPWSSLEDAMAPGAPQLHD